VRNGLTDQNEEGSLWSSGGGSRSARRYRKCPA
jgi:hypothetical protein